MNKLPFEKELGILIKKEAETDPNFGKAPEERTIEENLNFGIINLNKGAGPTSHQTSDYVKKILGADRAGHSGTLDPNVTGVLLIALNKGTRVLRNLLLSGKEYVCMMHLHEEIKEAKIKKVMKKFIGEIRQKPPVRSAVKRVERTRRIYYLEILEIEGRDILFRVGCEAGTYIRTLCVAIGRELKTGGHMAQLVRTKVARFNDANWVSLHDLKDAFEFYKSGDEKELKKILYPIEKAVEHLPKIWIFDSAVNSLCHGADLNIPGVSKLNEGIEQDDLVAVMTLKNELIGVGNAEMDSQDIMKKKRGRVVGSKKIFMERGVYSGECFI
jgi:H/ACA ribonucleoprotein complex subunit 4